MQQNVISKMEMSEDNRETTFLSQRLSTHLQRGNEVSSPDTFPQDWSAIATIYTLANTNACRIHNPTKLYHPFILYGEAYQLLLALLLARTTA